MRTLTPVERREIEAIKRTIGKANVTIEVCDSNAEMWCTVLDLALAMDEAIEKKWRKYQLPPPIGEIANSL